MLMPVVNVSKTLYVMVGGSIFCGHFASSYCDDGEICWGMRSTGREPSESRLGPACWGADDHHILPIVVGARNGQNRLMRAMGTIERCLH